MKVEKVVISGEMPVDCLLCSFLDTYTPHKNTDREECDIFYCSITGEETLDDGRPDWCPLMVEGDVFNWIMHRKPVPPESDPK